MSSGVLHENGSSAFLRVIDGPVHIALNGDFGGGPIAIIQEVHGEEFPLLEEGVAIVFTAADDSEYKLYKGDIVKIELSGSTDPELVWSIRGR